MQNRFSLFNKFFSHRKKPASTTDHINPYYEHFFTSATNRIKSGPAISKDSNYLGAVLLLSDYYKAQNCWFGGPSNPYSFFAKASRFFHGAWQRRNILAVSKVVAKHDPYGLGEGLENENVNGLLNDLKTALLESRKNINSEGELSKRIDFIQNKCRVNVINIQELNQEIKSNSTNKLTQ